MFARSCGRIQFGFVVPLVVSRARDICLLSPGQHSDRDVADILHTNRHAPDSPVEGSFSRSAPINALRSADSVSGSIVAAIDPAKSASRQFDKSVLPNAVSPPG